MAQRFSFDNAAFHFARTDGPSGFLLPFLIAYMICSAVVTAINLGVQILLFGSMSGLAEQAASGVISPAQVGSIMAYYLLLMVVGIIFWAAFEAAVQRRYVRDAGFSIGFGADELRLLVVGLLWFLFVIAAYIGFLIAGFIVMAPLAATNADPGIVGLLMILLGLVGLFVWIWLAVKLSAAGALTIRDRKIHFFSSWGATRGRFWPLFGAYLILLIIVLVVYFAVVGTLLAVVFGGGMDLTNPDTLAALGNPQTLGAMFFVFFLILTMVQALFLYIWAGPAALAAKTDPRGGGMPNVAEEFT
ncbi:MAG: hypothetical protein AAF996_07260 [Pseudomonadota bacterium]